MTPDESTGFIVVTDAYLDAELRIAAAMRLLHERIALCRDQQRTIDRLREQLNDMARRMMA